MEINQPDLRWQAQLFSSFVEPRASVTSRALARWLVIKTHHGVCRWKLELLPPVSIHNYKHWCSCSELVGQPSEETLDRFFKEPILSLHISLNPYFKLLTDCEVGIYLFIILSLVKMFVVFCENKKLLVVYHWSYVGQSKTVVLTLCRSSECGGTVMIVVERRFHWCVFSFLAERNII